jgi:hypothetical protein
VHLSLLATVLWAAGFVLNAALLFVLLYKRRYRVVPWFTAWIGAGLLYTIALFFGFRLGSKQVYALIYWSSEFLDVLLQIAVVLEIARFIFKRSGRWVEGARVRLVLMGTAAPVVALIMAGMMKPAAETSLDAWLARASLFTTILVCLLFTAVIMSSIQLGLGLRSHVMRESYGFILWNLVAFATDTLHAYWRTMGQFGALENVRIVVFQTALIYWSVAFWLPEPAVAPVTLDTINKLDDLAARLEYAQSRRASSTGGALPK